MIKVNLLKKEARPSAPGGAAASSSGSVQDFMGKTGIGLGGIDSFRFTNKKSLIFNLIVLLLFPVALIFYERHILSELKMKVVQLSNEVSQLEETLTNKQQEVAKSANLKEKAKELNHKIDILKKLANLRIREIKALDFIQSNMPEKVWLKDLTLKNGSLSLHGRAVTDDELSVFVHNLEKSKYFVNVLLLQAKEERTQEGSIKVFELSCNVEAD